MVTKRDYRDMVAGVLLLLLGLAAAWYASENYRIGTVTRMGAGMVPLALGIMLAGLGLVVMVSGWFRKGIMPEVRVLTPICIFGSIAVFGLMIQPFGLLPAVLASTTVASLAEKEFRPLRILLSGLVLCAAAWGIFVFGIGLSIPLLSWKP
ncbi:MAG: tripartite tricarboxylate transporter TctB family protein [Rhodobacteraceae bacterium]|nr:tripartite tricarboxylate transporter TctB family protein [Paracoccaceae bacterium]